MAQFDDTKALRRLRDIFAEHLKAPVEHYAEGGPVTTTDVDGGLYSAPNSTFQTPPSTAAAAASAQVYAEGGRIARLGREISDKFGQRQARRFERAADETNLERYSNEALSAIFSEPHSAYSVMPPSRFEDFAYPLDPDRLLIPKERGSLDKQYLPDGWTGPVDSYASYLESLGNAAKDGGLTGVPELFLGRRRPDWGNLPMIEGHDGRHRMRALDALGDPAALAHLRLTDGSGAKSVLSHLGPESLVLPEYWNPSKGDPWASAQPIPTPFASGGAVDTLAGPDYEDYGEARMTPTPAERRISRERRIADHVPAHSEEWQRLIDRHHGNPLSYGLEALGRLDTRAGAAAQGEHGWTARDYWDAVDPDPHLRNEHGYPGAVVDALGIGSMGAGKKVGLALGLAAPLLQELGSSAAGYLFGGNSAQAAQSQRYAEGGSVIRQLLSDVGKHASRVMDPGTRSQFRDLHSPDNDNLSRQQYEALRNWAAGRQDDPAWQSIVGPALHQNEIDEQWRRRLSSPHLIDDGHYDEGGRVLRAIRTIANAHGSLQGGRAEQAADLTNLDRLPTKTIMDLFDPKHSSLLTAMPTDAFQDYAPLIPEIARNMVPYPRWSSAPRSAIRGLPRDEQTMDAYLERMGGNFKNAADSSSTPALWLRHNPDHDMTEVAEHEGRHRMMSLNRMGDERGLVQLRPVNEGELRHPLEERLQLMMEKYFPQGGKTLVRPQDLATYEDASPLFAGHKSPRVPSPIYEQPFSEGGSVLTRLARQVLGKPDNVKIPGVGELPAHPIKEFEDVAAQFAKRHGNEYPITQYPEFDEDRARQIAAAYEAMKHDPTDPKVRRSYDALIDETMDQYRALEGTGAKFEFLKPGESDPYAASPSLGYHDLITNGRLKVFPTDSGHGTLNEISDNPLLRRVGRVGDLDNATANDAFRVVHDALGHFGPGNPFFRSKGEERAWNAHARSYSDDALPAATSETRGQNSWVNFGPYAAKNRGASGADTTYADQKVGLLPEWMYEQKATGGPVEYHESLGPVGRLAKRAIKEFHYPEVAPGVLTTDPKNGKEYLAKQLSPEAEELAKSRDLISKGVKSGNYTPFFDPTKRFDVDYSKYPQLEDTKSIRKIRPEVVQKYEDMARDPSKLEQIAAAYARGDKQSDLSANWYHMGQLEDAFISELGPRAGRTAFKDRFADPMAATTGGADPTSNLLMANYGNYLKTHGLEFPQAAHEMPYPIGGRYATGNMEQYRKMLTGPEASGVTPANPKRYNFSGNFLGDPSRVTMDEQMMSPWGIGSPPGGSYGHFEGAVHDLARNSLGIDPRLLQEVAWAGLKDAQSKNGYVAKPMISHVNDAIERTRRLTGMSPEETVRRSFILGDAPTYAEGGSVADDLNLYQSQFYAEGGAVADDFTKYGSMVY